MLTQVGAPKPGRAQLLEGIDSWHAQLSADGHAHVVASTIRVIQLENVYTTRP